MNELVKNILSKLFTFIHVDLVDFRWLGLRVWVDLTRLELSWIVWVVRVLPLSYVKQSLVALHTLVGSSVHDW